MDAISEPVAPPICGVADIAFRRGFALFTWETTNQAALPFRSTGTEILETLLFEF